MVNFDAIPPALVPQFEAMLAALALPPAVLRRTPAWRPGCVHVEIGLLTPAEATALRAALAVPYPAPRHPREA